MAAADLRRAEATAAAWAPHRARESDAVTFRLSRRESFTRALIRSQLAILAVVLLAVPDGSGGSGSGSAHVDVFRLVVLLVDLYLAVSLVGLAIGYPISRRKAVEIRLDGYKIGKRLVPWGDVPDITVHETKLAGRFVKAGKRKLPAPITSPFGSNPRFEHNVATIRAAWERDRVGGSPPPALEGPRPMATPAPSPAPGVSGRYSVVESGPEAATGGGTKKRKARIAGGAAVVVVAMVTAAAVTETVRMYQPRTMSRSERAYCQVYDETTSTLRQTFTGTPNSEGISVLESIFAERRAVAPTSQLRAAWETWWSFFDLQSAAARPTQNDLAAAADRANTYATEVCGRVGDL